MSDYKLIKKYPSLPIHWEEGMFVSMGTSSVYYRPCNELYGTYMLEKAEVENYPDFWVKVKKKDWEILSFRAYGNEYLGGQIETTLRKNGLYLSSTSDTEEGLYTLNYTISQGHWKAYSVKRLSDGVIFTLGDKVRDSLTDAMTKNAVQEINCISITENIADGLCLTICFKSGTTAGINSLTKVKPIFKTLDGVDMYVGDTCYSILFYMTYPSAWGEWKVSSDEVPQIVFSTREKAEEYIEANKPKVLFRTHDGYDVMTPRITVYSCLKKPTQGDMVSRSLSDKFVNGGSPHRIPFANEEACAKYLEENRPIYSKKSLEKFYQLLNAHKSQYLSSKGLYDFCISELNN